MMPKFIKKLLLEKYNDCFDTLKEVAKDDHDKNNIIYPIESSIKVLNFDSKLAEKLYRIERLSSVDTLDIQNNTINLIEFKNGGIKSPDLRLKGSESFIVLYKLLKENKILEKYSEIFQYKFNYYIVLNNSVQKNQKYLKSTENYINRERLNIGSQIAELCPNYKGIYFEKIKVLSFDQFQEYYLEKYYGDGTVSKEIVEVLTR